MKKIWGVALLLAIAGVAHGQVHKCVDAKGKTVYSEQPCASDQRGSQLLGRSATEANPERDAYAAQMHRESLSRTLQQNRDAIDGPPRVARDEPAYEREPAGPPALRPTEDADSAVSCDTWTPRKGCIGGSRATNPNWSPGKGYTGGSSPEDRQRDERDRLEAERIARIKPRPTRLTNCDAGGCWDDVGNRYNQMGAGTSVRSDGKMCRSNGNVLTCN